MKKIYISLLLLIGLFILLIFNFKPDRPTSIASLQQEAIKNSGTSKPTEELLSISTTETDIASRVLLIKKIIQDAPFKQEDTHSILAANPENIQKYLSDFSQLINENIMNNHKLSENKKAEMLWIIFKEYHWLGENNAFKAIVKENLMYLNVKSLIPDLAQTYADIAAVGDRSINDRHDLLEIISSIDIDANNPNNELIFNTMQSELRSINSRIEAQQLGGLLSKVFYDYAKALGVDTVPDIIQAANNNPQASLSYLNHVFGFVLSEKNTPQLQGILNANMNPSTRNDLNTVISFYFENADALTLSEINKDILSILNTYLIAEISNNHKLKNDRDIKVAHERIIRAMIK
ncbi:hypothetical protein EC844_103208 [Acinetobacter calcoaceticus]|uniref:Uncharacterized protein n=1 Tax=Acinetobacter calcoaceticus TaxID=471 RepID=A0A4R1Y160_ACICA|nr:hypothetical protein EC844_103208 [Acinetobacter calcoaceticus]